MYLFNISGQAPPQSPPHAGGKAWLAFGRPHMYQAKNSPPRFPCSEGVCDPGSLPETPVSAQPTRRVQTGWEQKAWDPSLA